MLLSARRCATFLCCAVFSSGACVAPALATTLTDPSSGAAQTPPPRYSDADRERRLADKTLSAGSPVMIRIFKKESELELWLLRNGRFELFETYPICVWSGKLGPKRREGDMQAPEGFYRVDINQLRLKGKNARTFYIDFPNAFDRALGRTGSAIMVHGKCQSTGCFSMTDQAMEEIYVLVERALFQGQIHIELHAFPFRMTQTNLAAHANSEWHEYWRNLEVGYDLFEQTRLPPTVSACGGKYVFDVGSSTLPDMGAPPAPGACEMEGPTVEPAPIVVAKSAHRTVKRRSLAARKHGRRRAGRNARKAYAAARRARMAAHARLRAGE
jgi:murein L,D-transpeptidase YafK